MRNKHSAVSDPNSFHTSHGNRFKDTFSSRVNPDGTVSLEKSGRIDVKAEINSQADACDMAVIINKLQFGDTSVLSSKSPMYGDFTKLPTSFHEAYDLVTRASSAFEALPVEIKQKFDNDVRKWYSTSGTPSWLSAMGLDVAPSVSESEVTE